jgi:hypothetical protein
MPFSLVAGGAALSADYTAGRAALLDRLALLQAGGAGELTIARAALLSNLDVAVSGRLGAIASIQTGSIVIPALSLSATAIISAVVVARTALVALGVSGTAATILDAGSRLTLTNATTVTATREGSTLAVTVNFMVIEFGA